MNGKRLDAIFACTGGGGLLSGNILFDNSIISQQTLAETAHHVFYSILIFDGLHESNMT